MASVVGSDTAARDDRERVRDDRVVAAIREDVRRGLSLPRKELPPKYFYDRRGSELFEQITRLPEYYLTRAERALLERHVAELARDTRAASLLELGAGSAEKTRLLLDAMRAAGTLRAYLPVDVSESFLDDTARRLGADYPGLRVLPVVADITAPMVLPDPLPRPLVVAFLGSTIGNFDEPSAIALLAEVRRALGPDDRLLLGADLRKDVATIERAYDDAAGVTAAFNRNMLHALNAALGADFEPEAYEHRARYDRRRHRIEIDLVASRDMVVHVPGLEPVPIRAGEAIRTEISCKYDRASIAALLCAAGLALERFIIDERETFALALAAPAAGHERL